MPRSRCVEYLEANSAASFYIWRWIRSEATKSFVCVSCQQNYFDYILSDNFFSARCKYYETTNTG